MGFAALGDDVTQYILKILDEQSKECVGEIQNYLNSYLEAPHTPFNIFSLAVVVASGVTFIACFVIIIVTIIFARYLSD